MSSLTCAAWRPERPVENAASRRAPILAARLVLLWPRSAAAWLFSEHRDISNAAVLRLPPAARAALEKLWAAARAGDEARFCVAMAAGDQGPPAASTFPRGRRSRATTRQPARPARKVVPSDWVLPVSRWRRRASRSWRRLAASRERKLNDMATSNMSSRGQTRTMRLGPGANNATFLLPRRRRRRGSPTSERAPVGRAAQRARRVLQ